MHEGTWRVPLQSVLLLLSVVGTGCRQVPPLDPAGKALLAPVRDQALHPAELIAWLAIAPTARIADVGAGPGYFTLPLLEAASSGSVLATDLRADYLQIAAARAHQSHLDARLRTQVVTVDDPGLAPGSLDWIFLAQVDHAFADRRQALARMIPALAPHGKMAVVNFLRYEAPMREALTALGFAVERRMQPSSPFYVAVYAR